MIVDVDQIFYTIIPAFELVFRCYKNMICSTILLEHWTHVAVLKCNIVLQIYAINSNEGGYLKNNVTTYPVSYRKFEFLLLEQKSGNKSSHNSTVL